MPREPGRGIARPKTNRPRRLRAVAAPRPSRPDAGLRFAGQPGEFARRWDSPLLLKRIDFVCSHVLNQGQERPSRRADVRGRAPRTATLVTSSARGTSLSFSARPFGVRWTWMLLRLPDLCLRVMYPEPFHRLQREKVVGSINPACWLNSRCVRPSVSHKMRTRHKDRKKRNGRPAASARRVPAPVP